MIVLGQRQVSLIRILYLVCLLLVLHLFTIKHAGSDHDIVERALDSTVSTRNTTTNDCCISGQYVEMS